MNILNKIWYNSYPPIDADSFNFQYIISKLAAVLDVAEPQLVQGDVGSQVPVGGSPSYAPPTLVFSKNSVNVTVGAIDTYLYPNVAYVWLAEKFGLTPDPSVNIAIPPDPTQINQPAPTYAANPVGASYGGGYFYAAPNADPKYWSPKEISFTDPSTGKKYQAGSWLNIGKGFYEVS